MQMRTSIIQASNEEWAAAMPVRSIYIYIFKTADTTKENCTVSQLEPCSKDV